MLTREPYINKNKYNRSSVIVVEECRDRGIDW